jgi:hypothetical protein
MSDFQDLLARGFEPEGDINRWTRTEDDAMELVVVGLEGCWTGQALPTGNEGMGCFTSGDTAREVVDKLEAFLASKRS